MYKRTIDGLYDASGKHELGSRYKFGGKEVVSGVYDFGARYYYPAIGRFMGVDPIAENFPHVSVYNYAENSPIINIDLWGLQKVHYLKSFNNRNTITAYSVQRQTSLGKKFADALNKQSAYDIVYAANSSSWSLFSGPIKTVDDFYSLVGRSRGAHELFVPDYD